MTPPIRYDDRPAFMKEINYPTDKNRAFRQRVGGVMTPPYRAMETEAAPPIGRAAKEHT